MPPKFPGLNKNLILIFIAVFLVQIVIAQTPADTLVHLKGAVSLAEQNYHLLKAGKYEAGAAYENVNVVKYVGYLPLRQLTRLEWQLQTTWQECFIRMAFYL
jgi:hypothetical protein